MMFIKSNLKFFDAKWLFSHIFFICIIFLFSCINPPQPVTVVFMIDSSASSYQYREKSIETVREISNRLDSQLDNIVIYKMGEDVYHLYSGKPKQKKLTEIMNVYATSKSSENGTAYGLALQRGLEEVIIADNQKNRTALIFLGDGADEIVKSGGNLSNKDMGELYKKFPKNSLLSFVYIEPRNSDRFRRYLYPVLNERLQLISPVEAEEKKALQKFYAWLER